MPRHFCNTNILLKHPRVHNIATAVIVSVLLLISLVDVNVASYVVLKLILTVCLQNQNKQLIVVEPVSVGPTYHILYR